MMEGLQGGIEFCMRGSVGESEGEIFSCARSARAGKSLMCTFLPRHFIIFVYKLETFVYKNALRPVAGSSGV